MPDQPTPSPCQQRWSEASLNSPIRERLSARARSEITQIKNPTTRGLEKCGLIAPLARLTAAKRPRNFRAFDCSLDEKSKPTRVDIPDDSPGPATRGGCAASHHVACTVPGTSRGLHDALCRRRHRACDCGLSRIRQMHARRFAQGNHRKPKRGGGNNWRSRDLGGVRDHCCGHARVSGTPGNPQ